MEYTERILIGMGSQIPVTQARTQLADLVNRVAYAGERIELTRHGKVVAALVSAADYDQLEDASPARPLGFVAGNDPAPAASGPAMPAAARDQCASPHEPGGTAKP